MSNRIISKLFTAESHGCTQNPDNKYFFIKIKKFYQINRDGCLCLFFNDTTFLIIIKN